MIRDETSCASGFKSAYTHDNPHRHNFQLACSPSLKRTSIPATPTVFGNVVQQACLQLGHRDKIAVATIVSKDGIRHTMDRRRNLDSYTKKGR